MQLFRLVCILACLALSGAAATAHAIVLSAAPSPGEVFKAEEIAVEIRFNSRIDVGRSYIKLFKVDGDAVTLPLADSVSQDTLKARATGLTPGDYRLHWQTLSPDGHISQGDIPFVMSR